MARGEAEHTEKIMMEFFQSFSSFTRSAFFHFVCVFGWFFSSLNANFHNVFCFIYLFLKSIATDAVFFLLSHTENVCSAAYGRGKSLFGQVPSDKRQKVIQSFRFLFQNVPKKIYRLN